MDTLPLGKPQILQCRLGIAFPHLLRTDSSAASAREELLPAECLQSPLFVHYLWWATVGGNTNQRPDTTVAAQISSLLPGSTTSVSFVCCSCLPGNHKTACQSSCVNLCSPELILWICSKMYGSNRSASSTPVLPEQYQRAHRTA